MSRLSHCIIATACGCMLLIGCGGGNAAGRATVYKVTGKVTMSGAPLAGALVSFVSKENLPAAIGRTSDAGEFTLTTYAAGDGAAAGKFAVVVSKTVEAASSSTPAAAHSVDYRPTNTHDAGGAAAAKSEALVPAQYGDASKTPLTATVEAKSQNQFTFDLK